MKINRSHGENHPNAKLTDADVEQIRQLQEWKREEIARINSIASNAAIAEKFDVSTRTIDNIGTYASRRAYSHDLDYGQKKTEAMKKAISEAKIKMDTSLAGDYQRRTGIDPIVTIREMARTHTKTEVAAFFGWKNATLITSWLKGRGYEVVFKKCIPIPPHRKSSWGPMDFRSAKTQSTHHAAQNTL